MKDIKIKTIIIGDSYSGKTTILNKYINKNYNNLFMATIGVDYYKTQIIKNGDNYKFAIWDTSGQEKFNSIISSYYRDIGVAIIVFDLTNYESFKNIKSWVDVISQYQDDEGKEEIIKIIVGNKNDLVKDRKVTYTEALQWCKNNKIDYIETSAKKSINLDNIFINIVDIIEQKIQTNSVNKNIRVLTKFDIYEGIDLKKKQRNCCQIL